MEFTPLNKGKTLIQMVVEQILTQISAGGLKPGDFLPVESKLAEIFNVGRSTIREALRILETKGIVKVMPRKGVLIQAIREESSENNKQGPSFQYGRKHLEALLDCYFSLLVGSARLVCQNRTGEDIRELKRVLGEIEKCAELITSGKADSKIQGRYGEKYRQFLTLMGRSTHNEVYAALAEALNRNIQAYLPLWEIVFVRDIKKVHAVVKIDQELVLAFESRDQEKAVVLCLRRANETSKLAFDFL